MLLSCSLFSIHLISYKCESKLLGVTLYLRCCLFLLFFIFSLFMCFLVHVYFSLPLFLNPLSISMSSLCNFTPKIFSNHALPFSSIMHSVFFSLPSLLAFTPPLSVHIPGVETSSPSLTMIVQTYRHSQLPCPQTAVRLINKFLYSQLFLCV